MYNFGTERFQGGTNALNLGAAWTKATGNQPPAISQESEDTLRQVILWTVLTSVVGAVVSFGVARLQRRFFN